MSSKKGNSVKEATENFECERDFSQELENSKLYFKITFTDGTVELATESEVLEMDSEHGQVLNWITFVVIDGGLE